MRRVGQKRGWAGAVLMGWCWASLFGYVAAEPKLGDTGETRAGFEERRERMRHQMEVEVESMTRVCPLDAKQRQRLEVAARGVVERILEDREKDPNQLEPVEWGWEEEGMAAVRAELLEHPLWRTTVREVLTSEQRASLEREQQEVVSFRRDCAIRLACGLLQFEMRLSEEQRDKFVELMRRVMPEGFSEPERDASVYTHWLEEEEVRRLLTEKQYAYWQDLRKVRGGGEVLDPLLR